MAQYYHILDADAVEPFTLATLTAGLPEDSRVMRALSGSRAGTAELLLAAMVDRLSTLVWFKTKDGAKGRNRPKSVLERFLRKDEEAKGYSVPIDKIDEQIRLIREG